MKKIVKATLTNCTYKRGIRDLNVQLYSHDKNNAGFEFTIKNEVDLSQYRATVLFDFQDTFAALETKGTIEGNVVKVKFDTDLITKCEEVIGYLMLDSDTNSLDVFKFKFNVVLSQIDRPDLGKRGFRYIKDQEVVDVITRSELEEEIKKLQVNGGIDLSNYLTISVAEATYVKKTDLPTPYNDSALVQKIGQLEARVDKDTVYDDTPLKERVTALESKALEGGAYDNRRLRDRIYNLEQGVMITDEEVKRRLTELESKPTVDTSHFITDETLNSKNYLTTTVAEETYAKKSEIPQAYNDSALVERVRTLENRPTTGGSVDTSHFITEEILKSKGFLTTHQDISNLATREELDKRVTKEELEEKHYVTNEQISSTYATKSEIPQPYSDTELVKRITVLENRQDNDTVYDDVELKRRVTALEEKPNVDTSNFITTEVLESKGYLTSHQDTSNFALKTEIPQPYNDSALVSRVQALETKQDNDTVYDDTKVKERLTALESKPNIDTSNFVTNEVLNSKGYLTSHQDLGGYVKKSELGTLHPNQILSLNNGTLSISGGNSVVLPVSRYEIHGTGTPNGVVEAEIGTTYIDKNKTNGAFKWIKTTDGGNQGWEVLTGDTGWRQLNILSKLGTASLHIRRVNNMVTYQFGGLSWGWFGIVRRGGAGYVAQGTDAERNCFILNHQQIPEGFRTPNSLIGSIYNDNGVPYGTWYVANPSDNNHLRFQFLNPVPTDRDIGDIRVSTISYLTNEPWPQQLP